MGGVCVCVGGLCAGLVGTQAGLGHPGRVGWGG